MPQDPPLTPSLELLLQRRMFRLAFPAATRIQHQRNNTGLYAAYKCQKLKRPNESDPTYGIGSHRAYTQSVLLFSLDRDTEAIADTADRH